MPLRGLPGTSASTGVPGAPIVTLPDRDLLLPTSQAVPASRPSVAPDELLSPAASPAWLFLDRVSRWSFCLLVRWFPPSIYLPRGEQIGLSRYDPAGRRAVRVVLVRARVRAGRVWVCSDRARVSAPNPELASAVTSRRI